MTRKAKKKGGRRATEPRRFRGFALMLLCGGLLLAGFFFAARQHFSSMDFGMKNSRLRKQVDDLQAEKRRLILARETSMTPSELAKVAKKIGLSATAAVETAAAALTKVATKQDLPVEEKPLIVKTASVEKTTPPVATTAALRSDTPVRSVVKKGVAAE